MILFPEPQTTFFNFEWKVTLTLHCKRSQRTKTHILLLCIKCSSNKPVLPHLTFIFSLWQKYSILWEFNYRVDKRKVEKTNYKKGVTIHTNFVLKFGFIVWKRSVLSAQFKLAKGKFVMLRYPSKYSNQTIKNCNFWGEITAQRKFIPS